MLFNSLEFFIFFPAVVILFFAMPHKFRWILLLVASYYFYMCWKVEYIILIIVSTLIDYFVGIIMSKTTITKKRIKYLVISLMSNLGLLFSFKYFNFFNDSLRTVFNNFNIFYNVPSFKLLLPVGISFYTFQTLSYTIDVFRGNVKPEKHLGIFALYVSFFPQLVAGPIERTNNLLPQFYEKHDFDYKRVVNGLKLMAWGFFKKLVIADRLALYVNQVYNNVTDYSGMVLIMATIFFAFQLYCDFSGYSDIAIGAAQVLGFKLMDNFNRPYFSKSISEFWRRWHISLSTWFKDYLYIPIGGNRVPIPRMYFNLFITFLISGLWHGANWTFIIWGALHGLYIITGISTKRIRDKISNLLFFKFLGSLFNYKFKVKPAIFFTISLFIFIVGMFPELFLKIHSGVRMTQVIFSLISGCFLILAIDSNYKFLNIIPRYLQRYTRVFITFILVCIGWVFFRANSLHDAVYIFTHIFPIGKLQLSNLFIKEVNSIDIVLSIFFITLMEIFHLVQRHNSIRNMLNDKPLIVRWFIYIIFIFSILVFGIYTKTQFVYFQF